VQNIQFCTRAGQQANDPLRGYLDVHSPAAMHSDADQRITQMAGRIDRWMHGEPATERAAPPFGLPVPGGEAGGGEFCRAGASRGGWAARNQ